MIRLRKSFVRRSLLAAATTALAMLLGVVLLSGVRIEPRSRAEAEVAEGGRTFELRPPDGDETAAERAREGIAPDGSSARDRADDARGPRDADAPGGPDGPGKPRSPSNRADEAGRRSSSDPAHSPGSSGNSRGTSPAGNKTIPTTGTVVTKAADAGPEPAPSPTPDELPPGTGLRGEYWDYDSELVHVPDLDMSGATLVRLDPSVNFENGSFNIPFQPLETFAVCWRGYFRAATDGHYAFVVGSDDGSLLEIDNVPVCGNDRLQGYTEARGELDLGKGLHVLKLRFFQNRGPCACRLFYVGPGGGDPVIIPPELLYPAGSGIEAKRPQVTSVTPAGAKRGDTITIAGAHFSEVPSLDKVTFGPASVPAVVSAASPTELQVVVPGGVDQGPISVAVGDQVAPGFPYAVGGIFGLLGRTWRDTSGKSVTTYMDASTRTLPDDERILGPLDIPGTGSFGFTFPPVTFRSCYTGRFYAVQAGQHGFSLDSDDGSRLFLDQEQVVDDGGLHGRKHVEGSTYLAQGWHDIEVDFYQNQGDANLTLGHADPGGKIGVCPRALLAPPEIYDSAVPPLITSVSPTTAHPGDQVAVQGQGFVSPDDSPTRVFLNAVELPVLSVQPSGVLVQIPSGADSGALVVRAGPLATPAASLTVLGYGLKGEYWNVGAPLTALPSFGSTQPDLVRTDDQVDFQEDAAFKVPWTPDHFAVRWTGDLAVPADGTYELAVGSDDGSRLIVDSQVVVDNDGLHGYVEVGKTVPLTAGRHSLTLLFFENEGDARCRLLWRPPGTPGRVVIPRASLIPAS